MPFKKFRLRRAYGLALLLGLCLAVPCAQAQTVVPGPLVPGRQGETLREPLVPESKPGPAAPLISPQLAPEQARSIVFVFQGLRIQGATMLPAASFDDLWKPLVGQTATVAQMFDIAQAITARYTQAGYALSFAHVPEQEIADGSVTVRIIEGFVDRVVLTGDPVGHLIKPAGEPDSQDPLVAKITAPILESRPLRNDALERALMLLNDLPGVKANASFAASSDILGASVLTIDVKRQVLMAEASADNRLSRDLGRWNIGSAVTLNGLFYGGDSLRLDGYCSRKGCEAFNEVLARWQGFFGEQGFKVSASALSTESRPFQGNLEPLEFNGTGTVFRFAGDYPVIRSRQESLELGGGIEVSNAETRTFAGTLTKDAVRFMDIHGTYDFADLWYAQNAIKFSLAQGLPFAGSTKDDDPLKSRLHGSSHFTNVTLNIARQQPLGVIAQELGAFSLYFEGEGQAALTRSLLSASQCGYGGWAIGRGYDSGALSGDHCLSGIAELRHDAVMLDIPLQGYVFGDMGITWIKGKLLEDEQRSDSAASGGFGLRFGRNDILSGDILLAVPFKKPLSEKSLADPRLFVALKAKY